MKTGQNTLAHRIRSWKKLRAIYMPIVSTLEGTDDAEAVEPSEYRPEREELFLPSAIPANLRAGLGYGLVEKERRIRESEADDALHMVRMLLLDVY